MDMRRKWSYTWRGIRNPAMYHGQYQQRRYFEGWYYKLVDPAGERPLAVIPGMAFDEAGESHAFIQVMDGAAHQAAYHRFDAAEFEASDREFRVRIGSNRFGPEGLQLDLPDLQGEIRLSGLQPWPWRPWAPGIMGWYAYVPFMQCYHGVVSLTHRLDGELRRGGAAWAYTGGKGYLEKDWGRSFPSSWVWMQSNHFEEPALSLTASVAKIPWLGSSFTGFIAGLWWKGQLYRFTTYTGARLTQLGVEGQDVRLTFRGLRYRLEIEAQQAPGAELRSPVQGLMQGRVNESLQARIGIRLYEGSRLLLSGTGLHAGLEVAGSVEELQP